MKTNRHKTIDRVEFRWRQHEEHFAERLAESAREAGRSERDHARELLKTALTSTEQFQHAMDSLHREIAQLQEQLRQLLSLKQGLRTVHENIYQLRDDLAAYVVKLLVDAGKVDTEAADTWVRETLNAE
jgi:hypothetical protein